MKHTIAAVFVIMCIFTSCRKNHTCRCIYPAASKTAVADTQFYSIEKETKKEATRMCEAYIFSGEICELQ